MDTKNIFFEYLRLFRLHAVSMEVTIILIGALIMGQRDLFLLFIIFIIGLLGHICGYVLNDYADVEIDKKLNELKKKPLVSGSIPKKNALFVSIITGFFTYLLTIIYFPYLMTFMLLLIATFLTILYDFYGKKIIGSDFIVAGSISVFFLFGASTVPVEFTSLTYIVGLIFFFDVVFINVVEGGLKDVDHDYKSRAKTLATIMNVKVKGENLEITNKFLFFAYFIRFLYILTYIVLGFNNNINLWFSDNYILQFIIVLLMLIVLFGSYKFLSLKIFDRAKMKNLYGGINAASGILLILMLYPIFGFEISLFLIISPLVWYTIFNKILYGKAMQPRV